MTDVVADPLTIGPDLALGVEVSRIPEGGVFAGHVDGEAVMLARTSAGLTAIAAACSHYSGPLHEGLRVGDHIHCPWHHACFDLRNGLATKAPALSPLACWRVEEIDGKVFVREKLAPVSREQEAVALLWEARSRANGSSPQAPVARQHASHNDAPDAGPRRIVIVGGGASGFAAAQRLRALGFDGTLTMLSADTDAPYDRPNVSKDYLAGTAEPEWMPLKDEAFYAGLGIDLRLNANVTAIDAKARAVTFLSGAGSPRAPDRQQAGSHMASETLEYDKLLLATGAEPIRPQAPGFDHAHVHTVRRMKDAEAIIADIDPSQTVAVIGSSFIGMEVAASLRQRNVAVHVIGPEPVPLASKLGPRIGALIQRLHEENGVTFHLGRRAVAYEDGQVTLDDGSTVAASRVVLGIGVTPRLALAQMAGLDVDRGVIVDRSMRTSNPDIFAAGDIARYPGPMGESVRIEHWVVAERLGQIAAAAMLGRDDAYDEAPYFWSVHYDVTVRYVGHADAWDDIQVFGSVEAKDAEVRYVKNGHVVAVATINRDLDCLRAGQRVPFDAAGP